MAAFYAQARAAVAPPLLLHGRRRIKKGMIAKFRANFDAYSKAAFAIPASKRVRRRLARSRRHSGTCCGRNMAAFEAVRACSAHSAGILGLRRGRPEHSVFESTAEDPDTMHVYGGWDEAASHGSQGRPPASMQADNPTVRYRRSRAAGRLHQTRRRRRGRAAAHRLHAAPREARAAWANSRPPLVVVCSLWRAKTPGILAASVSRDSCEENVVHDIRIFANHAAFEAHAGKEDPALTAAMQTWFENYDLSQPFTGELYMPGDSAADEAIRTSSIKDRPVRAGSSDHVPSRDAHLASGARHDKGRRVDRRGKVVAKFVQGANGLTDYRARSPTRDGAAAAAPGAAPSPSSPPFFAALAATKLAYEAPRSVLIFARRRRFFSSRCGRAAWRRVCGALVAERARAVMGVWPPGGPAEGVTSARAAFAVRARVLVDFRQLLLGDERLERLLVVGRERRRKTLHHV